MKKKKQRVMFVDLSEQVKCTLIKGAAVNDF